MQWMVKADGISKSYVQDADGRAAPVQVLLSVDISVGTGEIVTVFGPNACGKSTLLRLIAGLEPPDEGNILVGGKGPEQAKVGFIFQNFGDSLFPWRRVIDNIAFPLELAGIPLPQRRKATQEFLDTLNVRLPLWAYPYQLSSGQQQLVAIARALVFQPDVLLLDEPFSSLDFRARLEMQARLLDIWNQTRKTIVFVSHDLDEAIFLGDRLVLLSERPARVKEVFDITIDRPRLHKVRDTETFSALRTHIMQRFLESGTS